MTLEQYLSELDEMLSKATPGPWEHMGGSGVRVYGRPKEDPGWNYSICSCHSMPAKDGNKEPDIDNAKLIAASPAAIAKLVKIVRLQAEALNFYADNNVVDLTAIPAPLGFKTAHCAILTNAKVAEVVGNE